MGEKTLSTAEAAEIIGLGPEMVRRYCVEGRLESERVGRCWKIPLSAARRFARKPRVPGWPRGVARKS
jgi:excisionase family DNA binding protein